MAKPASPHANGEGGVKYCRKPACEEHGLKYRRMPAVKKGGLKYRRVPASKERGLTYCRMPAGAEQLAPSSGASLQQSYRAKFTEHVRRDGERCRCIAPAAPKKDLNKT